MAEIHEVRTSENRLATLIDAWLDGTAGPDDIAEMESLLLESGCGVIQVDLAHPIVDGGSEQRRVAQRG